MNKNSPSSPDAGTKFGFRKGTTARRSQQIMRSPKRMTIWALSVFLAHACLAAEPILENKLPRTGGFGLGPIDEEIMKEANALSTSAARVGYLTSVLATNRSGTNNAEIFKAASAIR